MERINKEFQGKDEAHILLDPTDIQNVLSVLNTQKLVIAKHPPFDHPKSVEGALVINNWLSELIKSTRTKS